MFSEPIFYSDTKLSDRFIFQISVKHKQNTFNKITALLQEINASLIYQDVEFEIRTEYPIEYMELIIDRYIKLFNIHPECIVRGRGHRKTSEQRTYDKLVEYTEKLKKYAIHINTCGDNRNSYSKTDNDATFFRMKRDYMGNDQLLSGYNIQFGVCDEYIAVCDIKQYASDMDCFIPLMCCIILMHFRCNVRESARRLDKISSPLSENLKGYYLNHLLLISAYRL